MPVQVLIAPAVARRLERRPAGIIPHHRPDLVPLGDRAEMGAVLRLARAVNVPDPDGGAGRPQPQPGPKLVLSVPLRHQQGRILEDLRHRPPKEIEQLRPETLRRDAEAFQKQLLARFAAFGLGAGLHHLAGQDHPANLEDVAAPQQLAARQAQLPGRSVQLPAQAPVRLRHRRRARCVKAKDGGRPVHVHPAIPLAVGAGVELPRQDNGKALTPRFASQWRQGAGRRFGEDQAQGTM